MKWHAFALALVLLMAGPASGIPTPQNTALTSGITSIVSGTTVQIVNSSLQPIFADGPGGFIIHNNTAGTLLFNQASYTTRQTTIGTTQFNFTARGLTLTLRVVGPAPNTSETLSLLFYPRGGNSWSLTSGGSDIPFATITTPLGSTMQGSSVLYHFSLFMHPGNSAAGDTPANMKTYAFAVPIDWYAAVNPSGASAWTYAVGMAYVD